MSVGLQTPASVATDFATLQFVVQSTLQRMQTVTLVRVIDCTNDGGVEPVGTVTVQPLVNLMTGDRVAVKWKPLYKLPYVRVQGGANAVIVDPKPGDIGLAAFCSRDISAVKATKDIANPGSFRQFDIADGVYLLTCLGTTAPEQYLVMNDEGVTILSPTAITLQAPMINLKGNVNQSNGNVEATGNIHTPGTITGDTDVIANGKSGATHTHGGVQSGSSQTNPPT